MVERASSRKANCSSEVEFVMVVFYAHSQPIYICTELLALCLADI